MARILGQFPAALLAARGGMSSNEFYRTLQSLGLGGRRSEVLRLYGIAKGVVNVAKEEPFRDISARPSRAELTPWPTKRATGIRQNVTLVYRDRTTGHILTVPWSTSSERGIRREEAMAMAVTAYSEHAERYNQDLIGAVHTGAYQYIPFANMV